MSLTRSTTNHNTKNQAMALSLTVNLIKDESNPVMESDIIGNLEVDEEGLDVNLIEIEA